MLKFDRKQQHSGARFGSMYTKIGMIQRRLAWPLRKDDTQIHEAFHIFFKFYSIFKLYKIVLVLPNIKMNPPQVYMCSPSLKCIPPYGLNGTTSHWHMIITRIYVTKISKLDFINITIQCLIYILSSSHFQHLVNLCGLVTET